jgi:hypothetical protein
MCITDMGLDRAVQARHISSFMDFFGGKIKVGKEGNIQNIKVRQSYPCTGRGGP